MPQAPRAHFASAIVVPCVEVVEGGAMQRTLVGSRPRQSEGTGFDISDL